MNSKDRRHLDQIQQSADYLMYGKGNGITNADVVEALINDVQLVKTGRAPEALPALVEHDKLHREPVQEPKPDNLTDQSFELFLELAKDASNWSGTPPTWGTKEQRGDLTQLKQAGLLTLVTDWGDAFVEFTQAGIALAAKHGIEF